MDINNLQKLGLSPYEAKCYYTLLVYGNLIGKEIAKHSNVPPTSVYRNLESLKEKGFVQIIQKEPLTYQAVDPKIAVASFSEKKEEELKQLKDDSIAQLSSIKKKPVLDKREEVLEVYQGRKQSYDLGKKLIQQSQKEFCLVGKGTSQSIIDLIHSLKAAVNRGVDCKFVVTTKMDNPELIEQLKNFGIKIKYFPLDGFSLLIKDQEESQIVIKDNKLKEERIVLRIKNLDLSKAHADYFSSLWKKATML